MEGSHAARREAVSFGRLVSFTDGVFAIAITLLVLNFEVPHIHHETERQLGYLVSELAGDFGAYFLTFAVVGRMWVVPPPPVLDARDLRRAPDHAQPDL